MENHEFYDKIADDVQKVIIQFISEAGWGKTSSLRTIIQYCKQKHPKLEFIVFDISLAWYKKAPLKYRQLVTREKIMNGQIANITDCVYEMGSLDKEEQRAFVGSVMKQHYEQRYQASLNGTLDKYPFLIAVFEESNIYFGSYALKRNDIYTPIFEKFVSVGRNFKMRGFLVATAEYGEMSPSLRRRSRRIYGRIESEGDLGRLRRKDKALAKYIGSEIPRYHFVYYGKEAYGPIKVPDLVTNVPVDFVVNTPSVAGGVDVVEEKKRVPWWRYAVIAIIFYTLGWLLC